MSESIEDVKLLKGFNAGYHLSKHEPDLFKKITSQAESNDPYLKGLLLGGQQYDRDKLLEQIKSAKRDSNRSREM